MARNRRVLLDQSYLIGPPSGNEIDLSGSEDGVFSVAGMSIPHFSIHIMTKNLEGSLEIPAIEDI